MGEITSYLTISRLKPYVTNFHWDALRRRRESNI